MKKLKFLTLVAGLALVFAVVAVSSASAATFSSNLTVGSRGNDVSDLQQVLIDGAYLNIATPTGYFGALTKAALAGFQKDNGISPAVGYFGPITRGVLNGMGGSTGSTSTTPGCSAGDLFSSTSGAACVTVTTTSITPGCAVGALFSSTTGQSCSTVTVPGCAVGDLFSSTSGLSCAGGTTGTTGTVSLDNTDGSITVSLDSYVGNQTLKKGETKDVYALKLQATAGKVAVTRFDVRMTVRPWLYFNKLVLKDSSGTVIAEKVISGSADATELTVGSDYLVRFDSLNYVVEPGVNKIVVVSASVLPTTDKLTSDVTLTVKTGSNGIRTMNGKGYTDSLSEATGRTVTLSSTGSTGNIVARVSASSPLARIQTVSTSGETAGVVLGVFDFKAENQSSTLNNLTFALNDPKGQRAFSTIFKRVYLDDGSKVVYADSVATSTAFSNLTIDLAKDSWKTLTLKADVADADDFANGSMASTSMVVNATNIVGIDSNFTTVTASGANTIAGSDVTLLQSGVSLSGMSASYAMVDNGTAAASTSTVKYLVTLNNTGSNDVYISKTASTFVATSTTAMSGRLTSLTSGTTLSGDTSAHFIIPSGGPRSFILEGEYGNDNGTSGSVEFKITTVYFDDDTTGLQEFNITYGLEALRVYTYQNN